MEDLAERVDALLREAIGLKRLVQLTSQGKVRVVEPHDYGRHNGTVKLLGYQVGGASSGRLPNWRWIEVGSIAEIRILDGTFAGGRGAASGKHHCWDEVYARVEAAGS